VSDRFCSQCNAEVEDAGGYCLLGHPLREVQPTASLSQLRAEVDRAFEEARVKVAYALGEAPPPPPPAPISSVDLSLGEDRSSADAISDFAPAPRMDWGPDRHGLRKRLG
jgi:hypothetical protein